MPQQLALLPLNPFTDATKDLRDDLQMRIDDVNDWARDAQVQGSVVYIGANGLTTVAPVRAATGTYAILTSDTTIQATSGTFTVTLPTAVGVTGKTYWIKNSGTGIVTIATTSSQTIDAFTSGSLGLIQYDAVCLQSDGANWMILGAVEGSSRSTTRLMT